MSSINWGVDSEKFAVQTENVTALKVKIKVFSPKTIARQQCRWY